MRFLPHILASNRHWAAQQVADDPEFFSRLCAIQHPQYLWIGCSDSRVPANTIIGLAPGEVFVHRNVANIVSPGDPNCLSVLQFAVDTLKIGHVIVCGHYRCGGIRAALSSRTDEPLQGWLEPIRSLSQRHEAELSALADDARRWDRLCELNVAEQVRHVVDTSIVRDAWRRRQPLTVHGWIYDLNDGLLRDLGVSVDGGAS